MRACRGVISLALLLLASGVAEAQTTVYPTELYRGQNVLTFSRPGGIERIEISTTRYIIADKSTGILPDCPDTVNVDVIARSVTNNDELEATVYGCDGSVERVPVNVERWTILQEFTGSIELGADTCLQARIESHSVPPRILDSITTTSPDFTILLMTPDSIVHQKGPDGYVVEPGLPFYYQICFRPTRLGYGTDTILLHFDRSWPNGGHTTYTIAKTISWVGVEPPPERMPKKPDVALGDRPIDPTSFRNILLPSARSMEKGEWFYGNYLLVGHLGGYGATDRLTVMAGGSFIPDFIARFYLGTIGAKYEVVRQDLLSIAVGAQVALSSVTDSDIRTIAPYGMASYGDDHRRVTLAAGYGFKRHMTPLEEFDRNAFVFGIGGNVEVGKGWKIAAELATIESSGILPLLVTGRRFGNSWAIDFGLGLNLAGEAGVSFNDALSGEIEHLNIAPYLSGMWVF